MSQAPHNGAQLTLDTIALNRSTHLPRGAEAKFPQSQRLRKNLHFQNKKKPAVGAPTYTTLLKKLVFTQPIRGRQHEFVTGLCSQALTALGPPATQHIATTRSGHPGTEAMHFLALTFFGLESHLHNDFTCLSRREAIKQQRARIKIGSRSARWIHPGQAATMSRLARTTVKCRL
jgi:hypothetical protein